MRPVAAYYSPQFDLHDMPGHPECADRLRAVIKHLRARADRLEFLRDQAFSAASHDELARVHRRDYCESLERECAFGGGMIDRDTYATESTFDVAALAAGACLAATRAVLGGGFDRALVLPRPPGHHAFADHAEGFCIFNNAAFAARAAIDEFGLERVLIVDWDVHHGNGTQAIFEHDPRVLYASLHQFGIYPLSGQLGETGHGAGQGATLNLPLPEGVGDAGYLRLFDEVVLPVAERFSPQLVIVSAGFDAHWRDPLAGQMLSLAGFCALGQRVIALANRCAAGRVVGVLEGGYDLDVLAHAVFNFAWQLGDGDGAQLADALGPAPQPERVSLDALVQRARALHGLNA